MRRALLPAFPRAARSRTTGHPVNEVNPVNPVPHESQFPHRRAQSLAAAVSPPSNVATNLDLLESCQNATEKLLHQLSERLTPVLAEDKPNPAMDTALPGCHCLMSRKLQLRTEHTMMLNTQLENLLSRLAI